MSIFDAAAAQARQPFHIAGGDLSQALKQFAIQADAQIIYSESVRDGLRSPPVVGLFSEEAALARLLSGAGLSFTRLSTGAIRVHRAAVMPPRTPQRTATSARRRDQPAVRALAPPPGPIDEVVVTGSRVIQNGNNMPTPVTVMQAQLLLRSEPSNIQDGLLNLPILTGNSPRSTPGNSSGNSAAHTLNLRGVGANRTLILFNGRRLAPTTPTAAVNIDIIPSLLLRRIEVVTGGASAVYGSDAVTGVVNFITETDFQGVKVEAQAGQSQRGDAQEFRFGIAAGGDFSMGRGHVEGSYERYDSPGVFSRLRRDWGREVWSLQGAGTPANPSRLVRDTRLNSTSFKGLIKSGPLAGQVFSAGGVLTPFQRGAPVPGVAGVEQGGDGAYYNWPSMLSRFRSDNVFARIDYDASDDVRLSAEFIGMLAHNKNNHQNNETPRRTVFSARNPFLAPAYQATMAADDRFTFAKMWDADSGVPGLQPETFRRVALLNAGLQGGGERWRWDVSYAGAWNRQRTRNNYNIDQQKLAAALDAVRAPNGEIVCSVSLTHPMLYPDCTPLNVFGPGVESAAAKSFILKQTGFVAKTHMDDVTVGMAGSPFSTWAGPIQIQFSGEWRRLRYELVSDAEPVGADCTGLRFNCTASTLRYTSNVLASRTPVSQTVREAAVEVEAPLLTRARFAKRLMLSAAFRRAAYDTSGGASTWKLGVNWVVDDQFTVRATRSRDFRAPDLNQLYAPRRINPAGCTDLFTDAVGQCQFITDSNPNLAPEVADTWTVGVVLRPRFAPYLSLAIDGFRIEIGNAITNLQGQNPTVQKLCYDSPNFSSPFCALQQRPNGFMDRTPANFITAFYSGPQNAQVIRTQGIDLEANYRRELGEGFLTLRTIVAYQPELELVQFAGAPRLNSAGTPGRAKWRATSFLRYGIGSYSIDIQQRWRSATAWRDDRTLVFADGDLPAAGYTNLTLSHSFGEADAFLSISNLFDRQPDPYAANGSVPGLAAGFVPGDDFLGRYFNVGFRWRR